MKKRMQSLWDVVIVGGGPAGGTAAIRLAQHGRRVLVLDKVAFPRFRLGESLLPQTLRTLDTLGVLAQARETFMVKRGAQFHDDASGRSSRFDFSQAFDTTFDHAFQVPRDTFDAMLLEHAARSGARVQHTWTVNQARRDADGRITGVMAQAPDGSTQEIAARFVIDATGRDALQAHAARATEKIPGLDKSAIYSHYEGVPREDGEREGDIHIVLFGGGWFWFIPFKDGRTSVGAVVSSAWMKEHRAGASLDDLLRLAIAQSPAATRLTHGAKKLWPARAAADFSYRVRQMRGPGWLAAGDAGGFIDPLFSTGVHIAITGGFTAADAIHAFLDDGDETRFETWETNLRGGAEVFISAVRAFYAGTLMRAMLNEEPRTFLKRSITSVLSGDVFGQERWIRDMRTRLAAMAEGQYAPTRDASTLS